MKDSVKKFILLGGLAAVIIVVLVIKNLTGVNDFHDKYEGYDLTGDVGGVVRQGTYTRYMEAHADAACPEAQVEVDLAGYVSGEDVEVYDSFEGVEKALYTGDRSTVTWEVDIPASGFYNIYLEYMTVESRGVSVERALYVNGQLPFEDAGNMTFARIWKDGAAVRTDNRGNEIRPIQVEEYRWQSGCFRDDMGYIVDPYRFYLEAGKNEITLEAVNEPLIIGSLTIAGVKENLTYEEYLAAQAGKTSGGQSDYLHIIEGEDSVRRSDSSLYAKYDRAAPNTSPYSVTKTVLNYVGGDAWSSAGQWIEWEFEAPEDGFYHLTVKGRQNYSRGTVSSRCLYIDGEIPFDEVKEISFNYDNDWNCITLSDEEGEPYRFYLTKGAHTLRLEVTLGSLGSILEELEDSTYRLNQIYRKILVYTGASPDKYRDYNIQLVYPEIIDAMSLESKRLYRIVDEMVEFSGQKAEHIASAQTLAQQLERFVAKPDKIPVEFTTFKDNITAMGTSTLKLNESKLDVDYLVVSGTDAKVKKDKAGSFAKIWHEIKSFAASYVVDYNSVGDVYDSKDEVVKVWVLTGRDQGTIIKSMVDDTFTPQSGVKVNVEIVSPNALLSAVVAGKGPNVVLSVGADQPVNYALRHAAEDLTQFADCSQVLESFTPSSYTQYQLEDGIYAIPETQSFNVMFYRKDVLEELGLGIPQTWKELIEMLPTIQGNNMSVGIPAPTGNTATPDISMYFTLLYQYGGDLYNPEGTATVVDSEAGVSAISDYTKYFTDYGIPTVYDFVSRFRSGEMPIGIISYTTYNTLVVSAPEIRGLWEFTLIPGIEKTDENGNTYIDRTDFISGTATMMIRTEDETTRNNAWEFMKWWGGADAQVRFGREMEALLGSSARYATANVDAFARLAWSADDIEVLQTQWEQTRGVREVPGGYYTGRHINNAIRKIINEKEDPRETILDYSITIDEEIKKKRIEFGMDAE